MTIKFTFTKPAVAKAVPVQRLDLPSLEFLEKDGIKTAKMQMHVPGIQFKNIQIRPRDTQLTVINRTANNVIKTFTLPDSVDPFTIETRIDGDDVLVVEAELPC